MLRFPRRSLTDQSPGLERATASIAMASDFAAMLDEMMGPERNIDLDKVTGKRRRFDDECRSTLFGGLLAVPALPGQREEHRVPGRVREARGDRSREELAHDVCGGECANRGPAANRKDRLGWERDILIFWASSISRCDDRVRNAREQLEAHARRVEDKVTERKVGWQTRIDAKMRASEEAGEAGLVRQCRDPRRMPSAQPRRRTWSGIERSRAAARTTRRCAP